MTAQPVAREEVFTMWQPDPMRQRLADHTIVDVLNLPEDAPRVELVDGVMLVVPSPSIGHQDISGLLWNWFRRKVPMSFRPAMAIGVAVGLSNSFEPDVVLVKEKIPGRLDTSRHFIRPDEAVIVVEVVSPGTRKRDRLIKPVAYAKAGIPYYWRIEQDPVHVFAYRLSKDGACELMADSAELLELSEPFDIKLPIEEITP